jgi:hypothetical protein
LVHSECLQLQPSELILHLRENQWPDST